MCSTYSHVKLSITNLLWTYFSRLVQRRLFFLLLLLLLLLLCVCAFVCALALYPVRTGLPPEYFSSRFEFLGTNWAILVQTGFSTPLPRLMHATTREAVIAQNCYWNSSFLWLFVIMWHIFQISINDVEKEIFSCHPRVFREDPRKQIPSQIYMLKSFRFVRISRGPRCCNLFLPNLQYFLIINCHDVGTPS